MTEKQAWLRLAKMWDAAKPDCSGLYSAGKIPCFGLCGTIAWQIKEREIVTAMLSKVRATKGYDGGYLWTNDKRGAKARAAFCRKQSALLTPKRKKGKVKS